MENSCVAYNINEIAKWQEDIYTDEKANPNKITLPSLQRGFVWKPHQIEKLWDSLLRGYPIGAILMSKSGEVKQLLDGQQRCTSIALGFLNPLIDNSDKEIFNLKKSMPSVWLDLKPLDKSKYGLKFGVRVLSRSHPWGYQLIDNEKPLSTKYREEALNFFRTRVNNKEISFADLNNNDISPWDCSCPIPLQTLLSLETKDLLEFKLEVKKIISSKLNGIKTRNEFVDYEKVTDEDYLQIFDALKKAKGVLVPEIIVDKELIVAEEVSVGENIAVESSDATLFLRLNTEGTKISGDELIYSLFKASFPEAKNLVENIGVNHLKPKTIISLFARLAQMQKMDFNNFQKEINVNSFRQYLKDKEFSMNLRGFIVEPNPNSKNSAKLLMTEAISILSSNDSLPILSTNDSLPIIYVKQIINKNPDLFLVLLIYIIKNKSLTSVQKQAIQASYHKMALFNINPKEIGKELFEHLHKLDFKDWNAAVTKFKLNQTVNILPLVEPKYFNEFVKQLIQKLVAITGEFRYDDIVKEIIYYKENGLFFLVKEVFLRKGEEKTDEQYMTDITRYWIDLSSRVFQHRIFLVLAQQNYFENEFKDFMEFEGIEDTNRPWDWDHIYPQSWVSGKHHINPIVRWLIGLNGNFRALSFNENRSQSNHQSPKARFEGDDKNKVLEGSFITNGEDLEHWLKIGNRVGNEIDRNELINAVFKRMNKIYEVVYDKFIDDVKN